MFGNLRGREKEIKEGKEVKEREERVGFQVHPFTAHRFPLSAFTARAILRYSSYL